MRTAMKQHLPGKIYTAISKATFLTFKGQNQYHPTIPTERTKPWQSLLTRLLSTAIHTLQPQRSAAMSRIRTLPQTSTLRKAWRHIPLLAPPQQLCWTPETRRATTTSIPRPKSRGRFGVQVCQRSSALGHTHNLTPHRRWKWQPQDRYLQPPRHAGGHDVEVAFLPGTYEFELMLDASVSRGVTSEY